MPGIHNVLDALAAIAVADIFEVPFDVTRDAFHSFQGVQRRFTVKGKAAGVTVIDDYGHHPTEIKAVLEAARQIAPQRIAVLFQPHRYTRTKALFEEFLTAFLDADLLYLMEIYPASEQPIEGVTGRALCEGIRRRGHKAVRFLPDRDAIPGEVCKDLQPGDMIITLGAGDVTHLGRLILEGLRHKELRDQ
jgi:UDP-N-acetylmuramate--alanine ligase